ncbi:MAG: AAA family ATPase [Candidatus Eremiobacteraeota bacterium]|nr:AAA family ATPase [Candidatus Eremiobacteraeota bacterium]
MTAVSEISLEKPTTVVQRLRTRLQAAVKGRDEVIDLILVAILADGHVLLEDYPGSGKTTLAKCLGESIVDDLPDDDIPSFRRIQFTPDLLPSDITGVSVFDVDSSSFHFRRGPIFAYVVLGDEINRTSPKVQAAMLEAMAEKQVTVDNVSYPLDEMFFVIATQNPLDLSGTYPLPVAQLDRFLFKIKMDFIDRESEIDIINARISGSLHQESDAPKVHRGEVVEARKVMEQGVKVSPLIGNCLVDIARNIRAHTSVLQGISTRSLVLAIPALRASAVLKGRDYVSEDDLNWLAPYIFSHRISLAPGAEDAVSVVKEALKEPLDALSKGTLK